MLEQLKAYLPPMGNGVASLAIQAIILIAVLWFLYYVLFAKKSYKNRLWALVVLILGVGTFAAFFIGGHKFGKAIGIGDLGTFIGMALFFFLAALWKYFTTPKDQRRKKFM